MDKCSVLCRRPVAINKTSSKYPISTESGSTILFRINCTTMLTSNLHTLETFSQFYLLTVSRFYKKIKGDYSDLSVSYNFLTVNSTPYLFSAPHTNMPCHLKSVSPFHIPKILATIFHCSCPTQGLHFTYIIFQNYAKIYLTYNLPFSPCLIKRIHQVQFMPFCFFFILNSFSLMC